MQRKAFTVAGLNAIKAPAVGRIYVYDAKTPSLALCVTANGTRTFYIYRRIDGKPQRVRLGRWPGMTIEQARKAALQTNNEIVNRGVNPNAEKRLARSAQTLGEAFDAYKRDWLEVRGRASTLQSDGSRFETHFGKWRDRKLCSITREDVESLHTELGRAGKKVTANRVVTLLRRIYNRAKHPTNPAARIDLFPEASRERFLQVDELPRFFQAVNQEDELFRDFFLLCLCTGARRGNVMRMKWDQLNLNVGTWTIPAVEFKTGMPLTIPLVPPALGILRRREQNKVSEYVFPAASKSGHLAEPRFAWERIRQRAKLPDVRIHDLRRERRIR